MEYTHTVFLDDLSTEALLAEANARDLPDTWSRNPEARPALLRALKEHFRKLTTERQNLEAGKNSLNIADQSEVKKIRPEQAGFGRMVMLDEEENESSEMTDD